MTNPCASHLNTCDHCALCESGVCCAGLSTDQKTQLLALIQTEQRRQHFHQAIATEAAQTFSLAEVIQMQAEEQVLGASLPSTAWSLPAEAAIDLLAAPAAASSLDSRKEALRVLATRTPR